MTENIINFFNINLDVIAKIQEGNKLAINSDNIINIEESYMFQGIWRFLNNISRNDAVNVLTKLFNDIEVYFNALYIKNSNIDTDDYNKFINIILKLENSVKGVENLKKTYISDTNICEKFDRILDKIKYLILNFQQIIGL